MFVHDLTFLKVYFLTLALVRMYDSDTIAKFKHDKYSKFKGVLKLY